MKLALLLFSLAAKEASAFIIPSKVGVMRADTDLAVAMQPLEGDRRSFLWNTAAASLAFATFPATNPLPARAAGVDYKAVAADIASLVKADPDKGPTLVRLAWHSSGTYDKMSKTGGSGQGTIRFKEELAHGGNAGLADTAVAWMEPIHAKYSDAGLSYADLYTLGGGKETVVHRLVCLGLSFWGLHL
jgi:hypothetical protein